MSVARHLLEEMIAEIGEDIRVDFVAVGPHLTIVEAGGVTGLAGTIVDERRPRCMREGFQGAPLKTVAALAGSWNLTESSIGHAALCAAFNSPQRAMDVGKVGRASYRFLKRQCRDMRVAMTCGISYITPYLEGSAQLSVMALEPRLGEYPAAARDDLLKKQDLVILGGDILITREFPRLMEQAAGTPVALAGFGVPLCHKLFSYGVDEIMALCVNERERCRELVLCGAVGEAVLPLCNLCRWKEEVCVY